jgi:hypothetical protein
MLGDIHSPALLAYWLRDAAEVGFHGTPQGALALLAQPSGARGIADFLAALREGLIAAVEPEAGNRWKRIKPRFGYASVVDEILLGMLRRISVRLLLEYAGRWHDHYRTLQEETALPAIGPAVQQWEALAPPLQVGELRVVGLVSEGDLLEEGRAMQHCVGSYVQRCWAYRSFVFSVRDATGGSLSTFELGLLDPSTCRDGAGPPFVRLVQHFGPANGQPSAQCISAAAVFVEHVERAVPVARVRVLLDKGRLRGEVLKSPRHSARHAWILGESLRRALRPRLSFDALIEQIVAAAVRLAQSSSDGA